MHRIFSALTAAMLALPLSASAIDASDIPVFSGTPYEIGVQHGRHFKNEINDLLENVLPSHLPYLYRYTVARFQVWRMSSYFPPAIREEMRGIADGADVDLEDVIYGNVLTDLAGLVGDMACSSYAVLPERSTTGAMLVGRNLDWLDSLTEYMRANLRAWVVSREGKKSVLMLGYPGMAGALTGINENGVYLSLNYGLHDDQTSSGRPVTFVLRDILENAGSAKQALELFEDSSPRTIGINTLITDAQSAFAVEASANYVAVRNPQAGIVYMANHFEHPFWEEDPADSRDYRWPVLTRYDNTRDAIGMDELTQLIGDAAMTDEDWKNVKAVLVDYSNMSLKFGSDGDRAALGELHTVDLNQLFDASTLQQQAAGY